LQDDSKYSVEDLPTLRTITTKLNLLNYTLKKVAKTEPKKKIPETDAIFEQVHKVNAEADCTDGVLRLSMDAKATVHIGPFSRGGKRLPIMTLRQKQFSISMVFFFLRWENHFLILPIARQQQIL